MKQCAMIVCALLLVGCGSSTKTGLEARSRAHARMNAVNADLAAQQARQQFEVGQLDEAVETIDAAIQRYDTNGKYHLLRGRILIEKHHLDAARNSLERAATLLPETAEPHYFLGVLHQRWSEDELAAASYKNAMKRDPSHPQYLIALAESYVALDRLDDAIQVLLESRKEFQHHPTLSALLGHIYLRKGDATTAVQYFSDSRLLGNDDIGMLKSLAQGQFQAAAYAECLMTLTQIQEEEDELPPLLQRLQGKCLAATGRLIRGRDMCLKVTRLTPDDAQAWLDLGYIAWEMGDYKRVQACGIQVSKLNPALKEGPLFEGIAAMHAGNDDLARQKLSKITSDNDIAGLDALIANLFAKRSKLGTESPITPNVVPQSAEGSVERHRQGTAEGSQPMVGVTPSSPHSP